jgi:hypothetical protein
VLRRIFKPTTQIISFNLPMEYLNKEIEILILPINKEITDEITFWSDDELNNFSSQFQVDFDS